MGLFADQQPTNYQEVLRAVGRLMDAEGFHRFRLIENEQGLILQMARANVPHGFETYLLTHEDIRTLVSDLPKLKGTTGPLD